MMMNQRTKTTLPTSQNLLQPRLTGNISTSIAKKQAKQQHYYNRGAKTLAKLHEGERVKVQPFGLGQKKWSDGKVIREVRPRSYEIEADCRKYIRNRKHLRKYMPAQESMEAEGDEYLPMPEENNKPERTQQERDKTQLPSNCELQAEPEGDQEYWTRSGRVSKRPVRFGELADL